MTVKSTTELRPWSYRQNALVKSLITIAAGVASAFVGTFAHRMGAELNIPYGLVLAFLLIGLSTWCARSRMGAVGLALHLIASSLTAWGMALTTTSGKALIVAGFQGDMPFFSQHAGYIWLYGLILVQVVLLILPAGSSFPLILNRARNYIWRYIPGNASRIGGRRGLRPLP